MLELVDDHIISLFLVMGLLIVTKVRDMLDNGGILAALTVGLTVSLAGHWTWLVVLMGFLVIGSSATRWRYEEKLAISLAEANEGLRGWRNVLANGAAPMLVSIINWQYPESSWDYLALSSCVAVACSDTLASEIGSLDTRTRSIINLEAVPQGTNGGMSPTGTVAAIFGALSIAILAAILPVEGGYDTSLPVFISLVSAIGWFGCQIDSLLGALLENQGYIGKHAVNLLATSSGAVLAVIVKHQFL